MPRGFPVGETLFNNCSTTALDAAATYTGEWVNVSDYSSVICAAKSDVAGTMYMDFIHKDDGTIPAGGDTPDSSLPYVVRAGITEPPHQLTVSRGWFRARYISGADAQTSFQLISTVGDHGLIVSPSNLCLAQNADATVARVIESELDISEGKRDGYSIVNKFGRNQDIDTATVPEDIWEGGGVYTGFPTGAAELVTVVSSSANDTAAGDNARTVRIYGLDANGLLQDELISLNGTSLVDSASTYTRVFRLVVESSGSSNQAFNAGTISVAHKTTTANVFLSVPAGINQSQVACYTIPADKTGYLRKISVEMKRSNSATADGALWVRQDGKSPVIKRIFSVSQTGPYDDPIYGGLVLPPLTDIAVRITAVSTNNTEVTANFDLILVDT